jgi:hypothetical protein
VVFAAMRKHWHIAGTSEQVVNSLVHPLFLLRQSRGVLQGKGNRLDPRFFEPVLKGCSKSRRKGVFAWS